MGEERNVETFNRQKKHINDNKNEKELLHNSTVQNVNLLRSQCNKQIYYVMYNY